MSFTKRIADDWIESKYYSNAERATPRFWGEDSVFRLFFDKLDPENIIELAVGHGRHVPHYEGRAKHVTLVDVNEANVARCRERFSGRKFTFLQNDGTSLRGCASTSYSAIFCYDAMVHFEVSAIEAYLHETFRTLRTGGRALFHHSNYDGNPGADYKQNPHWRNFMTAPLFAHLSARAGLNVMDQMVISWGRGSKRVLGLDCISLVEKRAEGPASR